MSLIQSIFLCVLLQAPVSETTPRPQDPQADSAKVVTQFWEAINERDPKLLRSTFAPTLRAELDIAKAGAIIEEFLKARGKIRSMDYDTTSSGNLVYFRMTTELGVARLKMQLAADGSIDGFLFKAYPASIPVPARNSMPLGLPFGERWRVSQGGRSAVDNYYMNLGELHRFAVDFVLLNDEGRAFKVDGSTNEDFFAFGKEILAVAPGRVAQVVDGLPDNLPGFSNPLSTSGNMLVIEHAEREFSFYCHLKLGSIVVKVGDEVAAGQVIARCGNSGRSDAPHLHFNLLNSADTTFATAFPAIFRDVEVKRGDWTDLVKDYEPRKGDFVRPKSAPLPTEGKSRPRDLEAASVEVADKFREAINGRKPELLRGTFAPNLLKELDPEKMATFIDGFRKDRGEIQGVELIEFDGRSGYFKLSAERTIAALTFNMVADGSISGLEVIDAPPPIPVPARNSMPMRLPFRGRWLVVEGGRDAADNSHLARVRPDNFAVDFRLPVDEEHAFRGDGASNEDFPGFGQEILAVAPGRVALVLDGLPDNLPGFDSPISTAGNAVVIRHAEHEFSVYAHLKHESIRVKVGDEVAAGQAIARCGNSGSSRWPHLHFELDNTENAAFASGIPPFFRDVEVERDGQANPVKDYEPHRGDYVRQK